MIPHRKLLRSGKISGRCICKVGSCAICFSACRRCGCDCDGVKPIDALERRRGRQKRLVVEEFGSLNSDKKKPKKSKEKSKELSRKRPIRRASREAMISIGKVSKIINNNVDNNNVNNIDNNEDSTILDEDVKESLIVVTLCSTA